MCGVEEAARAALRIVAVTERLSQEPHEAGVPIVVPMGLHWGRAMVGFTRFEGLRGTLWTFTASGPVTNLAARLGAAQESLALPMYPELSEAQQHYMGEQIATFYRR